MSRNKLTLLFGVLIIAMPFLGFPPFTETIFYVVVGSLLVVIAVSAHMRRRAHIPNDEPRISEHRVHVSHLQVKSLDKSI